MIECQSVRRVLRRVSRRRLLLLVLVLVQSPASADTTSSFGDRSGEGTTPFSGLAQSPEANLFTGALSTGISIEVPPGRHNMTPRLQLSYSSSGGPSPFGQGWSLTIGRIERTTRFGVPRYGSANFDEFVLILPGGASAELVPEGPVANVYRPKVAQRYLWAQYHPGASDYWTVRDGAGIVYTFGASGSPDEARLKSSGGEGPQSFTTAWGLTEARDANGNTIHTTWEDPATNGNQLLPDEINYGGHSSGTVAHFHRVDFYWTDNHLLPPEANNPAFGPVSFRRGVREQISTRLDRIEVSTSKAPAGLIRTYSLVGVDPGRANYRMAVAAVGDLPPQTFVYSEWSVDAHAATAKVLPDPVPTESYTKKIRYWEDSSEDVERTVMDMNGDGLLDLIDARYPSYPAEPGATWNVYLGESDPEVSDFGFAPSPIQWTRVPGDTGKYFIRNVKVDGCVNGITCTESDTFDITGDGIPDYVYAEDDGDWKVYEGQWLPGSPDRGQFNPTPIDWTAPTYARWIRKAHSEVNSDVLDMNADGLPDLVLADYQTGAWRIHLNLGDGFDSDYLVFTVPDDEFDAVRKTDGDVTSFLLADFNGDGLPDLIDAAGTASPPTSLCDDTKQPSSAQFVILFHECVYVYFNTGQRFDSTPKVVLIPAYASLSATNPSQETITDLVDINGDGLPDWVSSVGGGDWRVVLNVGGDFEPLDYALFLPPPYNIGEGEAPRTWAGLSGPIRDIDDYATAIDMLDLDGDGFLDRVIADVGPNHDWHVYLNEQPIKPSLITMMENGLGGTNSIRYEPSTNFVHVDSAGAPTMPMINWVVTATRLNDGLCDPGSVDVFDPEANTCVSSGNELLTRIAYEEGLFAVDIDAFGNLTREFRGFGMVEQLDVFGNTTVTNFNQSMHRKGLVDSVWTHASTGSLVRLETNLWQEAPFTGSQRTQVWLAENSRSNWDMGDFQDILITTTKNDRPDDRGNVLHTWTFGSLMARHVHSENQYVDAAGDAPRDKPKLTRVWDDLNGNGAYDDSDRLLEEKKFYYDQRPHGSIEEGNLSKVESHLVGGMTNKWVATTTIHDIYGNIVQVTDAENRTTDTRYDTDGQGAYLFATQEENALGHISDTEYDYRFGKPSAVIGPNRIATRVGYVYDSLGRIVKEILPGDSDSSPSVLYRYDFPDPQQPLDPESPCAFLQPCVRVERKQAGYAESRWSTTYFDALGRQRYTVHPRVIAGGPGVTDVRSEEVIFDGAGNVIERYDPYPDGGTRAGRTRYDYHLNGDTSVIDPLGRVWRTTLPDGNTTTEVHYSGATTETYDLAGEKTLTKTDAMGREIVRETYHRPDDPPDEHQLYSAAESEYDGLGRLLAVYHNRHLADVAMRTMTYDTLGRKIATDDRDSGVWTYGYDDVGNLLWQEDPKPGQHMQFCYDDLDRPTRKCGFNFDFATGNNNHYACTPGACGGEVDVVYEYDDDANVPLSIGYPTRVVDTIGETRVLGYDARGRQTGVIRRLDIDGDIGEARLGFRYNTTNEVVEIEYPDGEIVQMSYDASGQPMTLCNSLGYFYVTSAHYDIFGRLTSIVKGDGTTDTAVYYGANQNNRLEKLVFDSGTQTYFYNDRGQVSSITDSSAAVTHPMNNGGTYSYDDLGRLTRFDPANISSPDRVYDHDIWGNLTQKANVAMLYPNATVVGTAPHQTSQVSFAGGAVYSAPMFDENGNRTFVFAGGAKKGNASFNEEDRLASVDVTGGPDVSFDYDESGQQRVKVVDDGMTTSVTKYYNRYVEVRPDASTLKSYFFGGQRVASLAIATSDWQDDTLTAFLWGSGIEFASTWAERPVLTVTLSSSAQTVAMSTLGSLFVVLFLMPAGRCRRVVVGMRTGRATAFCLTLLFTTGTLPWPMMIKPADACTGCDCPTPTPPPADDIRFFHYDHLGSPISITDGDGNVAEHLRYHPYGAIRGRFDAAGQSISEPSAEDVRYEFTGYEAERNTGLLYANARFLDTDLGSFLTHDPSAQYWSPYAYGPWDPVNGTDPTGREFGIGSLLIAFLVGFAASAINAAINGASFGDALKAGLVGGALAAVTAPIGAALLKPLGSVLGPVATAVGTSGEKLASSLMFVGGLGQAGYGATQEDYGGLLSIGIGLSLGAILARGARPSAQRANRSRTGGRPSTSSGQRPPADILREARDWANQYNPPSVSGDQEIGAIFYRDNGIVGETPPVFASCPPGGSCSLSMTPALADVPASATELWAIHTHGAAPPSAPELFSGFSEGIPGDVFFVNNADPRVQGGFLGTPQGRLRYIASNVIPDSKLTDTRLISSMTTTIGPILR